MKDVTIFVMTSSFHNAFLMYKCIQFKRIKQWSWWLKVRSEKNRTLRFSFLMIMLVIYSANINMVEILANICFISIAWNTVVEALQNIFMLITTLMQFSHKKFNELCSKFCDTIIQVCTHQGIQQSFPVLVLEIL